MKSKRTLFLLMFVIGLCFAMVLGPLCSAQHAVVSIKNVSVQLVETRPPVGNKVIRVYNIIAVLQNSGDVKSDEISVFFYDPEYNKTTTPPIKLTPFNVSLNPDENKTFILNNWPTPLTGDVLINVSFKPSLSDVLKTQDNSGSYVYHLQIGATRKTTSTPGFEVAVVLFAILALLVKKQIKK
ncbi:MAG TPA: hypothetical protein DSN98_01180 [Thermoplasmata archaeon]|jgi:hypothetical protein|nr:MAG TPA: hypothetical protein DSN98_01180 [Thermoplasmata archaeon]